MVSIGAETVWFELDASTPPIASVPSGAVLCVKTRDALDGQVAETAGVMPRIARANPVTGPIAIDGVEAGDGIRIDILAIDLANRGYMTFQGQPRFFEQRSRFLGFRDDLHLVLEPMVGTIGVLPESGTITTKEAGAYGGNMDTRDVAPGSSLHLRSRVAGAGLYLGDVHALQGDGETSGQGVETAAEVILRVAKAGVSLSPWPYVIRQGVLMLIVSAGTLDEAAAIAVEEMAQVVTARSSLAYREARLLLSLRGDLGIGQIVNQQKTVRLSVPLAAVPWTLPPEAAGDLF